MGPQFAQYVQTIEHSHKDRLSIRGEKLYFNDLFVSVPTKESLEGDVDKLLKAIDEGTVSLKGNPRSGYSNLELHEDRDAMRMAMADVEPLNVKVSDELQDTYSKTGYWVGTPSPFSHTTFRFVKNYMAGEEVFQIEIEGNFKDQTALIEAFQAIGTCIPIDSGLPVDYPLSVLPRLPMREGRGELRVRVPPFRQEDIHEYVSTVKEIIEASAFEILKGNYSD